MNSLERAIKVLEMMGRHSRWLSNSQISRYLHISTSSTSYLLSQLEREGCVKRDEDTGCYQMGLRLVSLAHGALRATGLQGISDAVMQELAEATRLTVTTGALERKGVLVLHKVRRTENVDLLFSSGDEIEDEIEVGVRSALLDNASGRLLLAFLPPEQALELIAEESRAYEPRMLESLAEDLKNIRIQGHAVSDSGRARSLAAPIKTRNGAVRAALAVTGLSSNPAWEDMCNIASLVQEAAFKISRRVASHHPQRDAKVSGSAPKSARPPKAIAAAPNAEVPVARVR